MERSRQITTRIANPVATIIVCCNLYVRFQQLECHE
jgi:hypothetical protein